MNVREWALPVYTILMELTTGAFFIIWVIRSFALRSQDRELLDSALNNSLIVIFITACTAMIGAHFHLSKPFFSFLALLNLKSSWLSREILFNLLFFLSLLWLLYLHFFERRYPRLKTYVGWVGILFGWATVYSMSRIYFLPTQPMWNSFSTVISFFCTTLLLGFMTMASLMVMDYLYSKERNLPVVGIQEYLLKNYFPWFATGVLFMAVFLIGENIYQVFLLNQSNSKTAQVSVQILTQLYPWLFLMRLLFTGLGVSGFVLSVYWIRTKKMDLNKLLFPTYITCMLVIIGEILGRFLFYAMHVRIGI